MTNRELDILIAEKIFKGVIALSPLGRPDFVFFPNGEFGVSHISLPRFSNNIDLAWKVMEKVGKEWRDFEFNILQDDDVWHVGWFKSYWGETERRAIATARSKNIAKAICLAALETCEYK